MADGSHLSVHTYLSIHQFELVYYPTPLSTTEREMRKATHVVSSIVKRVIVRTSSSFWLMIKINDKTDHSKIRMSERPIVSSC